MTKADIFNQALALLLLQRRITDTATDRSNENTVLNTHYDAAYEAALADMDLDSTADEATLALVTDYTTDADSTSLWDYAYRYPATCAFIRRIKSTSKIDDEDTRIPLAIAMRETEKVILTNEVDAVAEIIRNDISESKLSVQAALVIAHKLAEMAAPLITGKGALKLVESIKLSYLVAKAEAQEQDRRENFNFVDPWTESPWVKARMT